jgi:hypothetical protein
MPTTHAVDLFLCKLPPNAWMAHSLPGLTNNLLSIAVLCNAGCKVFFNAFGCEVTLNGVIILQGWCDPRYCLWWVRIIDNGWTTDMKVVDDNSTPQSTAVAHSLYDCDNTQQLIRFYHACLFSPVVSTLINVIDKGYLKGFPGLTSQRTRRHIKINNAMEKGHMDQSRQGQCSTSSPPLAETALPPTHNDANDDILPFQIEARLTHLIFMVIHDITGQVYTDQMGRFPITSNHGHAYLIIFYIYDANFIPFVPIKNHTKEELLRAYQITDKYLSSQGFKPQLHKIDNKTSKDVKEFIEFQRITLQYTLPDIHRTNFAERDIRTWKYHFTAGIANLPKTFPIANWCCLTNQCNYTINMFCPCHQNPLLLSFKAMEGSFLFDTTPMAPPGTKILVHLKPTHCKSWAYHASNSWYIEPSLKHYRCIRAIMEGTGGKRLTDTFHFKHHAMPIPTITPTNRIIAATRDLTAAILGIQEAPPNKLQAIATLHHTQLMWLSGRPMLLVAEVRGSIPAKHRGWSRR